MNKQKIIIEKATAKDAEDILKLQKLAYISEAEIYNDFSIPPLAQTLPEVLDDFENYTILKAVSGGVIIGSVRGQITGDSVYIGRLMVHPDFQNNGLGTRLMLAIEADFPQATTFTLGTGHRSERNLYLYHKLGYKEVNSEPVNDKLTMVHMEKTKP
jgi:ribosomal protein S18 acetylase RimI-like enzyme